MFDWLSGPLVRRALLAVALAGLVLGLIAAGLGQSLWARWLWAGGTAPVVVGLAVSMVRDLLAGRLGVDAVALVSMSAALILGEPLAGVVVAIMYAGGNLLEDFAVARAERDLKALVDRAPRVAHRQGKQGIEDVAIDDVAVGDELLVRAGEVVPVDGFVLGAGATLDESALTGEPIPVNRRAGEKAQSGVINVGDTFTLRASATAGESAYAGIVRMATAAQTAKAPFVRIADRYALILLPVTLLLAGGAWFFSGDPIRGLAVLVASTPCPLILAAPVAFIAGVSRAARLGILIKGGGPLEALARTHTIMFDKTGTLTVGGARLLAIDVAVILNALRALTAPLKFSGATLPPSAARDLHSAHDGLGATLDRLREIADNLDDVAPDQARALIEEADRLVAEHVVSHEKDDESAVYPQIAIYLRDPGMLAAMSRAHREIQHSARLLSRLAAGLRKEAADRYTERDAQRVIESIEALVRIHSAQEEDIYEGAVGVE